MNRKRAFLTFHLLVLLVGLCPSQKLPSGFVTFFLNPYARLTAAGASYGFFSPNIANQIRVEFYLKDRDGRLLPKQIEELVPHEVSVRLGNMYRLIAEVYGNKDLRRATTASLTRFLFERHPEAVEVHVKITKYEIPGLRAVANGASAQESPVYSVIFKRAQTQKRRS